MQSAPGTSLSDSFNVGSLDGKTPAFAAIAAALAADCAWQPMTWMLYTGSDFNFCMLLAGPRISAITEPARKPTARLANNSCGNPTPSSANINSVLKVSGSTLPKERW